jgi:hypothetical protein
MEPFKTHAADEEADGTEFNHGSLRFTDPYLRPYGAILVDDLLVK